jgi:hypothetical protein
MKRNIVFLILAVILSTSLGAGILSAASGHNPTQGNKIIGVGQLGKTEFSHGYQQSTTEFQFTNTDCKRDITIEQINIIASDGTIIYEGPYLSVDGDSREEVSTLSPHEIRIINLDEYMYLGGDLLDPTNWLTSQDAVTQNLGSYTVEIDWDAKGQVSSLTGWFTIYRTTVEGSNKHRTMSQSIMVDPIKSGDE